MTGPLTNAAAEIEKRVEHAEEKAEEAAIRNQDDKPEPQPDHSKDLDLGERIGRLEEAQKQPARDDRVDGLLEQFGGITNRLQEILEDAVEDVAEVTPDPEPVVDNVVEPVEQAPKRVHGFLRKLW